MRSIMKFNLKILFLLIVVLSGMACNATTQSQTAQPSPMTKVTATVSPTPSTSLPDIASSQTEAQESERVADFGKQTGGKTIRVEFVPSQSTDQREKTWTDNGVQIKARFTPQSAKYETAWAQGTTDVYLVNAQAGQTLKVSVRAVEQKEMRKAELEQTAVIEVYNARTNKPLEGENDNYWRGKLSETGDYAITVVCAHGGTKYVLEVEAK
jgi:ABC-type phosphate/phosphonate transport system substrate-binding protein